MAKIKVWHQKQSCPFGLRGDTLEYIKKEVNKLIIEYGPDAKIDEQPYDWEEGSSTEVFVFEDETDLEQEKREVQEKEKKEHQDAYEKRQYEQLKKKFEAK